MAVSFVISNQRRDVRLWHLADIPEPPINVRFWG